IVAWAAGLFLATPFFGDWEDRQQNPNAVLTSQHGDGYIEVQLEGNRQGQIVTPGQIIGRTVELKIDTGATDVAGAGDNA
ncbi:TIGR02281 family clan AA aspartic protease, partial [Pseudomonas syringae pv. tagetis]